MKRRHLVVAGRVQGVWFRDSMRREAERHAVAGWVRNLPDGRVEAVLEGEDEAVERMTQWCHRGPPGARVTAVEPRDEPPEGLRGFRIAR
jgi:acylphosphatase